MSTRSRYLGMDDQYIDPAFARMQDVLDHIREDDGRGARPEKRRLHAFRYYLRKKITPERYLQRVLDGIVTAVNRNAGTCTVVAEGWSEPLENVHYYPPNKPPRVDDHHAVHFEVKLPTRTMNETTELEVADRWIKIHTQIYLYYMHTLPETKIWRIEWPPNEIGHVDGPSVPEVVLNGSLEWVNHDPALRLSNLLGVNQDGNIYVVTIPVSTSAGQQPYLEIWEPNGDLLFRYPTLEVFTEGALGQPGVTYVTPIAMDSEGNPPRILGQALVAEVTVGVSNTQTIVLYESQNNGQTWEEIATHPEGLTTGSPPNTITVLSYSGRFGYEYAGVVTLDSSEQGILGSSGSIVGLVGWPSYVQMSRGLALLLSNGNAIDWTMPKGEFANAVEAAAPLLNKLRVIAGSIIANPPPGQKIVRLYRTDDLESINWSQITLPQQDLWHTGVRIILAQDRFADKLIIAEYDADAFRIGTWFSEDAGVSWKEIDTTNTFHFVRGVVVEQ